MPARKRILRCLVCMMLIRPVAYAATQQPAQIIIAGQARDYILVTPDSLSRGLHPLVLILHGHIGTAANVLGAGMVPSPLSAWRSIADREKVLLAALQGLKGADHRTGWRDCRNDDADNPQSDDVAFAAGVVNRLVTTGGADPHRIFVMGMSNGAIMSYRLALEMRPVPAAIAAVSGTMALHTACTGEPHPVSILIIHGTQDPIVPYDGGAVRFGTHEKSAVTGVDATRDFWLRADGLFSTAPVSFSFPHNGDDGTSAVKTVYGSDAGPQVEVITVRGGGHVEPSLRFHYGPFYSRIVGAQNRDLESAEEAWYFFKGKTSD